MYLHATVTLQQLLHQQPHIQQTFTLGTKKICDGMPQGLVLARILFRFFPINDHLNSIKENRASKKIIVGSSVLRLNPTYIITTLTIC